MLWSVKTPTLTRFGVANDRKPAAKTTYNDTSTELITYGTGPEANLVTERIDRNGIKTTYQYDTADRPTLITTAAGRPEAVTETCTYLLTDRLVDAEGQTLLATDPRGFDTLNLYDVLGRTVRTFEVVTDPL